MTQTFRKLISELKLIQPNNGSLNSSPIYSYIIQQYKRHLPTSEVHCKEHNELDYLAETYVCLLENTRKLDHLRQAYSRKQLSAEESARVVGLGMPKKYE